MLVSVSRGESVLLERALWLRASELQDRIAAASPGLLGSRLAPTLPTVGERWASDLEGLERLALRVNDMRVAADRSDPWIQGRTGSNYEAWQA